MDFNDMLTFQNTGKIAQLEQKLNSLDQLTERVEVLEKELAEAKKEIERLKCK